LACATCACVAAVLALSLASSAQLTRTAAHGTPPVAARSPATWGAGVTSSDIGSPNALALDGGDLFVASPGGDDATGALTELNASTGALVRVISAPTYQFHAPDALARDGDDLFVASPGGDDATGALTELDASTGALIGVIPPASAPSATSTTIASATTALALPSSTRASGPWSARLPSNAYAGSQQYPSVVLSSVSCPSAGNCTAVGGYTDSSDNVHGFLMSESLVGALPPGSTPSTTTPLPRPPQTLYAYAHATSLARQGSSCPRTTKASLQCSLAQALQVAAPGDTVALATPGSSGSYTGNWSVTTPATSQSAPVLIAPAPGVAGPVLTGHGSAVLTAAPGTHVVVRDVTFSRAHNDSDGNGGAIYNAEGAFLVVEHCTFSGDSALVATDFELETDTANVVGAGGAIDSQGTLSVVSSTFTHNSAVVGGAIETAGGSVSRSSFTANSASGTGVGGDDCGYCYWGAQGGAIDNSGFALEVSASTFTANSAVDDWLDPSVGGAISNLGGGSLTVSGSSFSGNYLGRCSSCDQAGGIAGAGVPDDKGGAVVNATPGSLTVTGSVFSANRADGEGSAIWDSGTAAISASSFSANLGGTDQAAIVFHEGSTGALWASTLAGKGAVLAAAGAQAWVAADIFDGSCYKGGASWQDEGYNVGAAATCLSGGKADVAYGAGLLGALKANGGPTKTMLPEVANPALGLVPYGTSVDLDGQRVALCPATDQRGVRSAKAARCDAGSVQVLGS